MSDASWRDAKGKKEPRIKTSEQNRPEMKPENLSEAREKKKKCNRNKNNKSVRWKTERDFGKHAKFSKSNHDLGQLLKNCTVFCSPRLLDSVCKKRAGRCAEKINFISNSLAKCLPPSFSLARSSLSRCFRIWDWKFNVFFSLRFVSLVVWTSEKRFSRIQISFIRKRTATGC